MGTIASAGYAAYRAKDEEPARLLARMIGGAIGGQIGGAAPDVLEPASWPGHRQVAHSLATGAFVVVAPQPGLKQWDELMQEQAAFLETRTNMDNPPLKRLLATFGEGYL